MECIKIFSAPQIKEIDRKTIENQKITSEQLMERAVDSLLQHLEPMLNPLQKINIMAGVGNNGGDGLVLARKLWQKGMDVRVYVVRFSKKESDDFQINYKRLLKAKVPVEDFDETLVRDADLYIDAIFGVGLNRPASGIAAAAIEFMNRSGRIIYAIDMPSGLYADRLNSEKDPIVKSTHVFSFQFPKYSFFFEENGLYVPSFSLVDIGLDIEAIRQTHTDKFYLTAIDPLPPRKKFSSKKDYSHALLIGGSEGKAGAVAFASKAAFVIGAGWVSAMVPRKLIPVLQTAMPEIMCMRAKGKSFHEDFLLPDMAFTAGIGPGLGLHRKTVQSFGKLLRQLKKPAVIDADALNILARKRRWLKYLPAQSVLTPHAGEFARLTGKKPADSLEKFDSAKAFAKETKVVLCLKGAHTLITNGKKMVFNSTGNPALAKAGSGDVLTGIITGLMAQGLSPWKSALKGVFLHGKAADIYVRTHHENTLSPQDLIEILKNEKSQL